MYNPRCSNLSVAPRHLTALVGSMLLLTMMYPQWPGERAMAQVEEPPGLLSVIPQPVSMTVRPGTFTLTASTVVALADGGAGADAEAHLLTELLARHTGWNAQVRHQEMAEPARPGVLLRVDSTADSLVGREGYLLEVTPTALTLTSSTRAGLFYGIQTLLQLLPAACLDSSVRCGDLTVPCVAIRDTPRFGYRGMHLDVSRHFFPVWFVKRYIDLIAFHKMNVFHWHLTDDNGWRIEIPKYPRLAEVAAWRVDREGTTWREREPQQEGEIPTYGGFYTQEEIRDVVEYAARRHVMVIPEIEMPGHTSEVLAAYPELSCTGGPFTVATGAYWPNVDIFCAGNDSVFVFLEDVLQEVMRLFPGPYLHVGGDEADKRRWRECPRCQERIRSEGLADEDELQSYFMKRVERIVTAGGKRLVGWDEILEGGLPPRATVMSWRGVEGGIQAAQQGHDVIMTPVSHCYFDYYQGDPEFEPEAIGGHTTLKEVYEFEPVPPELSPLEARHVLGAQGNLWTEYIPTPSHAEYMSLPRMSALAEVVWSPADARNWQDFRRRLEDQYRRLDAMGAAYSRGSFRPAFATRPGPEPGAIDLLITSEQRDPLIRFTTDGREPDADAPVYGGPLPLEHSTWVSAALFNDDARAGRVATKEILVHKGLGSQVQYRTPYSTRFSSDSTSLVDGLRGSLDHTEGYWQGFRGAHLDVDVVMPTAVPVERVRIGFLVLNDGCVVAPTEISVELSTDGSTFTAVGDPDEALIDEEGAARRVEWLFTPEDVLPVGVIRIKARGTPVCPPGHAFEGMPNYVLVDEVVVE